MTLTIYSILWIKKSAILEPKQKKANIWITIFLPFWIFILKAVLKTLKNKNNNDKGWVRQEGEGSVRGSWCGGGFNQN